MIVSGVHAEKDLRTLRRLVRENPLGLFTTSISLPDFPLIQSSHIPFLLDIEDESNENELGRLRGHMARLNPQSKAIIEELTSKNSGNKGTLEHEVLVMFNSPIHHYVPTGFYTESKPTTGKVAPTWNYAAVQVYGKATFYIKSDENASAFLQSQMHDLSEHCEIGIMGYDGKDGNPEPWKITDAPEKFVELLKKAVLGFEIEITRMEGKFKMSQERAPGDVEGVIKGFRSMDTETAKEMADLVEQRRELMAQKKSAK
ncbi:transcriptional regulator PAI 2-type [Mariannaea sp. PMI_226]|nr:transcriptional regulator PAI 2-type [Mariannaea sp. PMI_226]